MLKSFLAFLGPQAFALGDYYNQMALHALVRAAHKFGISFDIVIPRTSERVQEDLRSCLKTRRYDVAMAFGNAMQEPTVACAKEFPGQRFALIDGSAEGIPNVVSYSSDPLHVSFLCGLVAMKFATTRATGCVLWSDNWVARQWIGGFVLGAKNVEPAAKVYYSFAGSADEAYARASLQMKKGADMIMCHAGAADLGIIRAASENGRHVIGFLNERDLDHEHVVFDVVRNMGPLVTDAVKRATSSRFKGGRLIAMGLKEGSFDFDLKNVHAMVTDRKKELINRIRREVKRGKFDTKLLGLKGAPDPSVTGGISL